MAQSSTQVLVTGVTRGIGRALTLRLLRKGQQVWGIARSEPELAAIRDEFPDRFSFSVADISEPRDIEEVLSGIDAAFRPDAVVLNAAIYPHDADGGFDADIARRILATNVNGALGLVGPLLKRSLDGRHPVQFLAVSSLFALRPDPLSVGYAASKAALNMAFRSLALRYRGTEAQFKTIVLGPITTEGPQHRLLPRWHLGSVDGAAAAIESALYSRRRLHYYPRMVGWAVRGTSWLPDSVFDRVTRPLRR